MATDTAARPIPDRARRLWQLPTFLVGLAALYALWHSGDRLRPTTAERFHRALAALRTATDRWPPDVDQVQAALRRLPANEPPAELAAQVRFLTGSAYVALAETTTSPTEAAEWWQSARQNLEAADIKSLPGVDLLKYQFRLARTWANSPGTDPNRTIEAMAASLTAGDDPAEGYRLLADLYAKLSPPDEVKARDSLRNFLKHASARADSRILNLARLRLAELHLALREPDEARKVLERVGPEAPPEVYAASRLLVADYLKADENWPQATKAWEQVRDMKGAAEAQRSQALVRLTEAYSRLNRPEDLEATVKEVIKGNGPEARSVALNIAGMKLNDPDAPRDAAIAQLETALAGITGPDNYPKAAGPISEAQKLCAEAYERAKADGDFPLAARAAALLGRVDDGPAPYRLAAEAHAALAANAAQDPARVEEARQHYRAAADACAAIAKRETVVGEKGDWLRKAAGLHVKGDDRVKAQALLTDLVAGLPDYPEEKAGQAWADLGDVYLQAGDKKQAALAFRNAAGRPGPAQPRARVRYAALVVDGDPAQGAAAAVPLLEEVVNAPEVVGRDPATHEEALYALGELLVLQRQWPKAEARLRSALATYPDSPFASRGRLQFGVVFRQRASEASRKIEAERATLVKIKAERLELRQPSFKVDEQIKVEERRDRAEAEFRDLVRQAYDAFRQAEERLLTANPPEPELIRRALFNAADCAFYLGEYEASTTRYEKIALRYRDKAEELEAIVGLYRTGSYAAHASREEQDAKAAALWTKRAIDAHAALREALDRIPAAELNDATDVRKRGYWEKWLADNAPRR